MGKLRSRDGKKLLGAGGGQRKGFPRPKKHLLARHIAGTEGGGCGAVNGAVGLVAGSGGPFWALQLSLQRSVEAHPPPWGTASAWESEVRLVIGGRAGHWGLWVQQRHLTTLHPSKHLKGSMQWLVLSAEIVCVWIPLDTEVIQVLAWLESDRETRSLQMSSQLVIALPTSLFCQLRRPVIRPYSPLCPQACGLTTKVTLDKIIPLRISVFFFSFIHSFIHALDMDWFLTMCLREELQQWAKGTKIPDHMELKLQLGVGEGWKNVLETLMVFRWW